MAEPRLLQDPLWKGSVVVGQRLVQGRCGSAPAGGQTLVGQLSALVQSELLHQGPRRFTRVELRLSQVPQVFSGSEMLDFTRDLRRSRDCRRFLRYLL